MKLIFFLKKKTLELLFLRTGSPTGPHQLSMQCIGPLAVLHNHEVGPAPQRDLKFACCHFSRFRVAYGNQWRSSGCPSSSYYGSESPLASISLRHQAWLQASQRNETTPRLARKLGRFPREAQAFPTHLRTRSIFRTIARPLAEHQSLTKILHACPEFSHWYAEQLPVGPAFLSEN